MKSEYEIQANGRAARLGRNDVATLQDERQAANRSIRKAWSHAPRTAFTVLLHLMRDFHSVSHATHLSKVCCKRHCVPVHGLVD
jgi:hypothetical protein